MSKHTTGPWEAGINPKWILGGSNFHVVRPKEEFPHGLWVADCGRPGDDEAEANARLIAAAPDLLRALKDMVDFFDGYQGMKFIHCKEAIAKAEGLPSDGD